jgi:plasmid stabilization system protein ParE
MRPYRFHPEAEAEADAGFEYYWAKSPEAALNFDDELRTAYAMLRKTPHACPPYLYETRRALLNRFPYFVVFRERARKIEIIAIAHAKRRPGYWAKRLKQ